MEEWTIDYNEYLADWSGLAYEEMVKKLKEDFIPEWVYSYKMLKSAFKLSAELLLIRLNGFEYIYDCEPQSAPAAGLENPEPRVVVVYGTTDPQPVKRDDARLKGWVGPTQKIFGKEWDKGHFIAHVIGGRVDNQEINVFQQLRSLNRGWSEQGKKFRKMETYCSKNKGLFCFHRPVYFGLTAIPDFLEFGVLRPNGNLWVEYFNNRSEIL